MHVERERRLDDGLSRRQLLARGAIAGGLVWAAPIIRTTAAYATTANGTERPCIDFFVVVINPAGQVRPPPESRNAESIPPAIRQWFRDNPDVPIQFPAVTPQLTQTSGSAWAILLPAVEGPNAAARQCRMVLGWGRHGNSFAEGYVDPNPPFAIDVGRRLIFPCAEKPTQAANTSAESAAASTSVDPNADPQTDTASEFDAAGSFVDSSGGPGEGAAGIGADGSATDPVSSDGGPTMPITGDGRPTGNTGSTGGCLEAVYLVYCCPR